MISPYFPDYYANLKLHKAGATIEARIAYTQSMLIRMRNPMEIVVSSYAGMDRVMRASAAAAFAVLAVHWALIVAFLIPRLGTLRFLRLHYTASQGIDWVDDWRAIFTFPAVGLAALACNYAFAAALARNRRPLGRMILIGTVLVEAIVAVGGVIAVLLNG
ncbi:MAG: hypothetical protein RL272_704 [Candidatus Parcubacteria bacterium]|jgi:phosphatidylglycerophosphate synthase